MKKIIFLVLVIFLAIWGLRLLNQRTTDNQGTIIDNRTSDYSNGEIVDWGDGKG
jgi:hypothetical protein